MISFECDYNNGAHPKVLQRLIETNNEQSLCYGDDKWSMQAKEKIKAACGTPDAQVFFLTGGTQTNATVIDSILHTYEGVIAVDSGHINTHEAGAIEFTEHKVITLRGKTINLPNDKTTQISCKPSAMKLASNCRGAADIQTKFNLPNDQLGKMDPLELDKYLDDYMNDGSREHAVYPGMVYITFPTEYGTLYTAKELDDIYQLCRKYDIPLYVDGARLGYGLTATGNDITLPYLTKHCDVFYIGGTKVGALSGEAVVFTHNNAHNHFFSIQKQHGAVIAKGRLHGLQFDALFTDNLYFDIARHANVMAEKMRDLFKRKGYRFYIDSPTNQQFVIINNAKAAELEKDVIFTHWGKADNQHVICRFVTSWATTEEDLKELERIL
jgi:threonine aldolase